MLMYLQLLLEGTLALHRCDSISTSSLSRSVGPRRDARRQKERERETDCYAIESTRMGRQMDFQGCVRASVRATVVVN